MNTYRRKFFKILPYTATGILLYPIGKFVLFNDSDKKEILIDLKNIGEGITKLKKLPVVVYKKNDNIKVMDAHCTHMGCIVTFFESKYRFICPCHRSEFSIIGEVIKGPATKNLEEIEHTIKNNKLFFKY